MNVDFINPFIISTVNVLKTMAATEPTAGTPAIKVGTKTWGDVSGIIGMAGDEISGNMIISFQTECILPIVSNMLMEKFESLGQEVVDAVGEITNMVSGGAKKILSEKGYTFSMATPMMILGKNVELIQLAKSPTISIPFTTNCGGFVIEANLAPR